MPFDEPVLGVIGMWTLGGGPNPHSALALGVGELSVFDPGPRTATATAVTDVKMARMPRSTAKPFRGNLGSADTVDGHDQLREIEEPGRWCARVIWHAWHPPERCEDRAH